MPLEIIWSAKAKSTYFKVLDQILKKWTLKEVQKFDSETNKHLALISSFPEMCSLIKRKSNIYRCVITSQTSVYYKIRNNKIYLITFWDNRQSSSKLRLIK